MQLPPIQYARTDDGVNIAFWTLGEGPPLVVVSPFPGAHLELEARGPVGDWDACLAARYRLVRFDPRGFGLSDRQPDEFSIAAYARDLAAVVDRLEIETFALFGGMHGGPVAISYAAAHPERVSHLLLWNTYAVGADLYGLPKVAAITQIRNIDFDTWALAIGQASAGWSNTALGAHVAEVLRNSADWETIPRALAPTMSVDLTEVLASVQAPTLVMYRGEALWGDAGLSRALAAGIGGSQLHSFPGDASMLKGDEPDALEAITSFVPPGASSAAARPELVQSSSAAQPGLVQTIVFTDVEGSTDLTDRFGDARARDLLREHEDITREALAAHAGTEIKTMGDGFMASFASASGALDAAIAMQRAMRDHFSGSETPIRIRVGINVGEPIAEDDDLYGTAVIRAARIMAQADGGEILVSDLVRGLVAGKDYLFDDRGPAPLKGFEEPVRLFSVRW